MLLMIVHALSFVNPESQPDGDGGTDGDGDMEEGEAEE